MPLLRAFPWENSRLRARLPKRIGKACGCPGSPSATAHPCPCVRRAARQPPALPAPHSSQPLHPSRLDPVPNLRQRLGQGRCHQAFGLSVVKRCSMCLTLRHFTKLGKNHPRLVAGAEVTQHVRAGTSLPSARLPVPGRPWEGCSCCSPFGDAAPFPSAPLPAPLLGSSSGFPGSPVCSPPAKSSLELAKADFLP